jgi:hypothetical protein
MGPAYTGISARSRTGGEINSSEMHDQLPHRIGDLIAAFTKRLPAANRPTD